MRQPVPTDWDEDRDGYLLAFMCIPNSRMWRAIVRGKISDLSGFNNWDKKTGYVLPVIELAQEIFDSMGMCKLDDLLTEFKRMNAILAGEELTVVTNGQTQHWDYRDDGLVPTLEGMSPAGTVSKLEEILTMLETRLTAETTAANTRTDAIIAALSEIDASTTVNLNNGNGCGDGADCGDCGGDSFSVQLQE